MAGHSGAEQTTGTRRTFRSSRIVALMALPLLALVPLILLAALWFTTHVIRDENRIWFFAALAIPFVILLPILYFLLRGAYRLTLVDDGGGDARIEAKGVLRRDAFAAPNVRAIRASGWDANGMFPKLQHADGSVRLLAIQGLPELARELRRRNPDVDIEIGLRVGAFRRNALVELVIGIGLLAGAVVLSGPIGLALLPVGVLWLSIAGTNLLYSVTLDEGPPPIRRDEGRIRELRARTGVAIRQGRRRAGAAAFVPVLFVVPLLAFAVLQPRLEGVSAVPTISLITVIALIVLNVPVVVMLLRAARAGGPGVALLPEGLVVFSPGRDIEVAWDEIDELAVSSLMTQPVVQLRFTDAVRRRQPAWWRALARVGRRLTGADTFLAGRGLGTDSEALYRWLRDYRDDPLLRDEIGTGAALRRLAAYEAEFPSLSS